MPCACTTSEILDAHPAEIGEVHPWLHRQDVAGGNAVLRASRQPRVLVNLESDGVAKVVHRLVAVLVEHAAGEPVDLLAALSHGHLGERAQLGLEADSVGALEERR